MENEIKIVKPFGLNQLGRKGIALSKKVEIGKWFKFSYDCIGEEMVQYGKVVAIKKNKVYAEKVFELPAYRPYASTNWFDNLPMAIK